MADKKRLLQEGALELRLESGNGAMSMRENRGQVVEQVKDRHCGIGDGRRTSTTEQGTYPDLLFPEISKEAIPGLHGEWEPDFHPRCFAVQSTPDTTEELPQSGCRDHVPAEEGRKEYRICAAASATAPAVAAEEPLTTDDYSTAVLFISPKIPVAYQKTHGAAMGAWHKFQLFSVLFKFRYIAKIIGALRGITHNTLSSLVGGYVLCVSFFEKKTGFFWRRSPWYIEVLI